MEKKMSCQFEDFKEDFLNQYSEDDFEIVNKIINNFLEGCNLKILTYSQWFGSLSKEKNDALNYTYHIDLSKDGLSKDCDDEVNLSFYTGVDVGCELVHYSLTGASIKYEQKTITVIDDIKPDWSRYSDSDSHQKKLIQIVLDRNKDKILELYRKMDYDNHVTGGGTVSTNEYYRKEFEKYRDKNIHWNIIYKEIEVDRNFD